MVVLYTELPRVVRHVKTADRSPYSNFDRVPTQPRNPPSGSIGAAFAQDALMLLYCGGKFPSSCFLFELLLCVWEWVGVLSLVLSRGGKLKDVPTL
jgi:hypothetical protein